MFLACGWLAFSATCGQVVQAAAEDEPIVRIKTDHRFVDVYVGEKELEFTIFNKKKKIIADRITLDQLAERFPKLYKLILRALALPKKKDLSFNGFSNPWKNSG